MGDLVKMNARLGNLTPKHTNYGNISMSPMVRHFMTGTRSLPPMVSGPMGKDVPLHHLRRDANEQGLQHLTDVCPAAMAAHIHVCSPPPRATKNLELVCERAIEIAMAASVHTQEHSNERTTWPMWAFQQAARQFGLVDLLKLCTFGFHSFSLDGKDVLVRTFPHIVSYFRGEMCSEHTDDLSERTNNARARRNSSVFESSKVLWKLALGEHKYVDLGVGAFCGTKNSMSVFRLDDSMVVGFSESTANQTPHLNPPCDECPHMSVEELRAAQQKKGHMPCHASFMFNFTFVGPVQGMELVVRALDVDFLVDLVTDIQVDMSFATYMDLGSLFFLQVKRILGQVPGSVVQLVASRKTSGEWAIGGGNAAASVPIMLKPNRCAPLNQFYGVPNTDLAKRLAITTENRLAEMEFLPLTPCRLDLGIVGTFTPPPPNDELFQKDRMWISKKGGQEFVWRDWKGSSSDHLYEQGKLVPPMESPAPWSCPAAPPGLVRAAVEKEQVSLVSKSIALPLTLSLSLCVCARSICEDCCTSCIYNCILC